MSDWTLRRYRLGETVTDGQLLIPEHGINLCTLERPWFPGQPGGVPFASCVPDGTYQLERFTRPNGDLVLRLWNTDLGVYRHQGDVPEAGGRYLVLIHAGNWVRDIVGCIAPGLTRIIDDDGKPKVTPSRPAMDQIMEAFRLDNPLTTAPIDTTLQILTAPGAYN